MTIIERGRQWLPAVRALGQRTPWEERQCPSGGGQDTWKHGTYQRRPWTVRGRHTVVMQRYRCRPCRRTSGAAQAAVAPRRWYGRDVQRLAIDQWVHGGSSLRRTAEHLRSWLGHQERWRWWRPWEAPPPTAASCRLGASTVHRWLDAAGARALQTVPGQLRGVPTSGQFGADGLWAKLVGGRRGWCSC